MFRQRQHPAPPRLLRALRHSHPQSKFVQAPRTVHAREERLVLPRLSVCATRGRQGRKECPLKFFNCKLHEKKIKGFLLDVKRDMAKVSNLHNEILSFAAELTPTPQEHERCERVIESVRKLCYEAFGSGVAVTPFGSYANGLATRSSDVDLVIENLLKPDTPEGFFGYKQAVVGQHLQYLEEMLMQSAELELKHVQLIAHAKVPVLKFTTCDGVMVDLSINDESGSRAARYVLDKVRRYPPLRPLCLVLKAFLKAYGLSEVKDGGLGGFALTNIVVAHIQETMKAGRQTHDFGKLLVSFFNRFGNLFDCERDAVSVWRGGVVSKQWVGPDAMYPFHSRRNRDFRHYRSPKVFGERWFIENPVTGMDVAQGSYNIHIIRDLFITAYWALRDTEVDSGNREGAESPLATVFNL